jgi:hypothetical protein
MAGKDGWKRWLEKVAGKVGPEHRPSIIAALLQSLALMGASVPLSHADALISAGPVGYAVGIIS